jgi:hypothetical protein
VSPLLLLTTHERTNEADAIAPGQTYPGCLRRRATTPDNCAAPPKQKVSTVTLALEVALHWP